MQTDEMVTLINRVIDGGESPDDTLLQETLVEGGFDVLLVQQIGAGVQAAMKHLVEEQQIPLPQAVPLATELTVLRMWMLAFRAGRTYEAESSADFLRTLGGDFGDPGINGDATTGDTNDGNG